MTPKMWSLNALSVELGVDRRSLARRDESAAFAVLTDLVHEILHGFSRSAVPPDVEERLASYKRARDVAEIDQ